MSQTDVDNPVEVDQEPFTASDAVEQSTLAPKSLLPKTLSDLFRPGIRQGLVVLFDQGFCSITSFLTAVLVARACGKAEYGLYVLGFTLIGIVQSFQSNLLCVPYTVYKPHLNAKNAKIYLGSTLLQQLIISFITVTTLGAFAGILWLSGKSNEMSWILLALSLASVPMLLRGFMRQVLLASLNVWGSLIMGLAANACTVATLFYAYLSGWLTPPKAIVIVGACSVLPIAFAFIIQRHQIAIVKDYFLPHLKKNWNFGKWTLGGSLASIPAVQIYPWVLAAFAGPAATGVYGACLALTAIMNPIFMGINSYIGPKSAHAATRGILALRRTVWGALCVLLITLAPFVLAIVILGEKAVVLVYGAQYGGTASLVRILAISTATMGLAAPVLSGISAAQKPKFLFKTFLVAAAVSVLAGVPLTILLGPLGACLGLLISMAVSRGLSFVYFLRLTNPRRVSTRQAC